MLLNMIYFHHQQTHFGFKASSIAEGKRWERELNPNMTNRGAIEQEVKKEKV